MLQRAALDIDDPVGAGGSVAQDRTVALPGPVGQGVQMQLDTVAVTEFRAGMAHRLHLDSIQFADPPQGVVDQLTLPLALVRFRQRHPRAATTLRLKRTGSSTAPRRRLEQFDRPSLAEPLGFLLDLDAHLVAGDRALNEPDLTVETGHAAPAGGQPFDGQTRPPTRSR